MHNPIKQFNWASLYKAYDDTCKRFDPNAPSWIWPRPGSDRELYYMLVDRVQRERKMIGHIGLGTYEAILYWKLYSQPAAVKTVCTRIREETHLQEGLKGALVALGKQFPNSLTRDIHSVQRLYRSLDRTSRAIYGLASSCALPTRSTLLHFHYPTVIPIFDKQVLLAVGVDKEEANRKYDILFEYIQFPWDVAGNPGIIPQDWKETPLRLLDMALWVIRGKGRPGIRCGVQTDCARA